MVEILIYIYLAISAITFIGSFFWLLDECIEGVDNFWDLIVYSIFWIIQPLKAIFKLFKTL